MTRLNAGVAACALVFALAGCSKKDAGTVKSDSAVADSIRHAHDAMVADSTASAAGASTAVDSVHAPVNSTAGTIGETRKRPRLAVPDTMGRDSVVHGPYKTMDSLGRVKR